MGKGGFRLTVSARAGKAHGAYLARMLRQARPLVKGSRVEELSIAIVGDKQMAELHELFMGIAGPTDVLTFELEHDSKGKCIAGEVVVNFAEARRRAKEHGVEARDELLLYAVHGLLHLSGHDDTTKMAYEKMHRMEDRILKELGVGAVFAPVSGRGRRKSVK